MLQTLVLNFSLYEIIFYFIIYSIMGWTMETIICSINERKFVDRGYFSGPYCPIYGVGMCAIIICLTPVQEWPIIVFFGGALIATVIEYITGWLLETLFNTKWWDYSEKKFNLHGRVCLSISVAWGCLSLIIINLVQPLISYLVTIIPESARNIILTIVIIIMTLDFIHSTIIASKLSKRIRSLDEIKTNIHELYEKSKWAENSEHLKQQLETKNISQLIVELGEYLKENIEEQKVKTQHRLDTLKNKYSDVSKPKFFERRLINAFPAIKSKLNKNIKREIDNKEDEFKPSNQNDIIN